LNVTHKSYLQDIDRILRNGWKARIFWKDPGSSKMQASRVAYR